MISEVEDTGTDNTAQGPNQEKVGLQLFLVQLPECGKYNFMKNEIKIESVIVILGCRLQKYWFKQGNDIITTVSSSLDDNIHRNIMFICRLPSQRNVQ